MDYKKLNNLLKDIEYTRRNSKAMNITIVKKIDEPEQVEEGISYEIYDIGCEDMLLRLELHTDSYGDNERLVGIQFVKGVQKMAIVYEEI